MILGLDASTSIIGYAFIKVKDEQGKSQVRLKFFKRSTTQIG